MESGDDLGTAQTGSKEANDETNTTRHPYNLAHNRNTSISGNCYKKCTNYNYHTDNMHL